MNTKNAFFAARNRSRRTVPVMANNATNVPLATSVSAAAADLSLTPSGSFTATASRPTHSLPRSTDAASKASAATSPKPLHRPIARCHRHPHGYHLFRPPVGYHGSLRRSQQASLDCDGNQAGNQRDLHAGGRSLREKGVVIQSIICDGKSGLLGVFPDVPIQMCQFHQIKIIVRHLTRKPKSPAAQANPARDNSGQNAL